jgi:hypothetical protein
LAPQSHYKYLKVHDVLAYSVISWMASQSVS